MTSCNHCGVELVGQGKSCSNCGTESDQSQLLPDDIVTDYGLFYTTKTQINTKRDDEECVTAMYDWWASEYGEPLTVSGDPAWRLLRNVNWVLLRNHQVDDATQLKSLAAFRSNPQLIAEYPAAAALFDASALPYNEIHVVTDYGLFAEYSDGSFKFKSGLDGATQERAIMAMNDHMASRFGEPLYFTGSDDHWLLYMVEIALKGRHQIDSDTRARTLKALQSGPQFIPTYPKAVALFSKTELPEPSPTMPKCQLDLLNDESWHDFRGLLGDPEDRIHALACRITLGESKWSAKESRTMQEFRFYAIAYDQTIVFHATPRYFEGCGQEVLLILYEERVKKGILEKERALKYWTHPAVVINIHTRHVVTDREYRCWGGPKRRVQEEKKQLLDKLVRFYISRLADFAHYFSASFGRTFDDGLLR